MTRSIKCILLIGGRIDGTMTNLVATSNLDQNFYDALRGKP